MQEFGDILDVKEATEFLKISRQLLVKEIESNGLPGRKVGREWRFSKRALIEWIEEKQKPTVKKIKVLINPGVYMPSLKK